jgi:chlorite dismutase
MQTDILSTNLGCYLDVTYSFTATTKQSQYLKDVRSAGVRKERPMDVIPIDSKYLIMYPMDKVRPWYGRTQEERGSSMREHAMVGRNYPSIKLNTAYSFGIDDQEFVVAFETDSVHDFLDLMMELRHTDASQYTLRDTPIFTCISMSVRESLDALGGVKARVPART